MAPSPRRRFLQRVGALVSASSSLGIAGCSDAATHGRRTSPSERSTQPATVPSPLDGSWESYRHDAANTAATDDPGPTESPSRAWHTRAATGSPAASPTAIDGAFVTVTEPGFPLALEADSGAIRWTGSRSVSTDVAPVGTDGTVVVADGSTLVGLAADSGRERWTAPVDGAIVGLATAAETAIAATDGGVTAVSARDGTERWHRDVDGTVATSPAATRDTVAVGSASGRVIAIDGETGDRRWRVSIGDAVEHAPAIGGDAVYAVAGSRLVALEAASGQQRWRETGDAVFGTSPVAAHDRVYAATVRTDVSATATTTGTPLPTDTRRASAHVRAFTAAKGLSTWRARLEGTYSFHGPGPTVSLAAAKDRVFAMLDNELTAFAAATGDPAWSRVTATHRPAVADGIVSTGTEAFAVSDGTVKWSYQPGSHLGSSPAVVGNTLYVGSDDYHVYAMTANSGEIAWRTRTDGPVRTAPAVDENSVYVGTLNHTLYALNRDDGTVRWTFDAGGQVQSPTLADGTLYVGNFNAELVAVNAERGTEVWRVQRPRPFLARTPAVADGTVVAGSNGDLRAFDAADGTERWHVPFTADRLVQSTPAVADDRVFLNVGDSLRAFDLGNGTELWRHPTGGSHHPPAVADGTVYAPGGRSVYAVDAAEGTERWRTPVGDDLALILGDGTLYGRGLQTPLIALDAEDGRKRWRETGVRATTTPILADEYLFVGTEKGFVRAYASEQA